MSEWLLDLARRYPRFGYRRLHQMLVRQGVKINVKRVRRLSVKLGLKLPTRRKRKRRGIGTGVPVQAEYPNHVCPYDFVFDWSESGRQLKILTVEDELTRECLAMEVDHRMGDGRVCEALLKIMMTGVALRRMCGSGQWSGVHRSKMLMKMLSEKGVQCRHIEPGSPWQNGKAERFNGTLRSECTEMETFHHRDHARAVCRLFQRYYNTEQRIRAWGTRPQEELAAEARHYCDG